MLKYDGITYVGMADHHKLATGYAKAGFYLYPTSYPETGCVSLMKAQALGAIPITSRHYNSTLPELTGRFDLGPLMPSSSPRRNARIENDKQWQREWADAVVAAATSSSSDLSKH